MLFRSTLAAVMVVLGWLAAGTAPVKAQPAVQVLAVPGGEPDDITVDPQGRLVWGNLSRGTIERLQGNHVVTVVRGLSVPEGIVTRPGGVLLVAEQGLDRIDRINSHHRVVVLHRLAPVSGQEGVDGIGWDTRSGTLLVPDSPRGIVLRVGPRSGRTQVLVSGLGRPVDAAVGRSGSILVPDEHLGTLAVIAPSGRVSYRGQFATPDDVAVDGASRIWVTALGDNALWNITPDGAQHLVATGMSNPQGLTLDRCGDPIVVEQGAARIVRLLLTPRSSACRF
jgi:sugar lactone lactonase YvrE